MRGRDLVLFIVFCGVALVVGWSVGRQSSGGDDVRVGQWNDGD